MKAMASKYEPTPYSGDIDPDEYAPDPKELEFDDESFRDFEEEQNAEGRQDEDELQEPNRAESRGWDKEFESA